MAPYDVPQENPNLAAAEALRGYVKDKDVNLQPANSVDVSLAPGDKNGLTYLAKEAYLKLGYPDNTAKDACIMLAALFVEKLGPNPKLSPGTQLHIGPHGAELIRMVGTVVKNEKVSFGEALDSAEMPAASLGVRLGMDLVNSPDGDLDKSVARGLRFDSQKDNGSRDFFQRFYMQVGHYSIQDSGVATTLLLERFEELNQGALKITDGDLLLVEPDKAVLQMDGKKLIVPLADEADLNEQHDAASAAVVESTRQEEILLSKQVQTPHLAAFGGSLGNQLIAAVPNVIVEGAKQSWGMHGESWKVYSNDAHYTVVRNEKNEYNVFAHDGPGGALRSSKTGWTKNFEDVKTALA